MTEPDATPSGIDRRIPEKLSSLYQEVILDHYRRPRNKGTLEGASHSVTMNNPLCGDVIELDLEVEGNRIVDARFSGKGCSISQASASMLTQSLKGRTTEAARELAAKFTRMMHGDDAVAKDRDLGDLRALAGVSRFPVRIKCALLGFNCVEELLGSGDGAGESPSDRPPRGES